LFSSVRFADEKVRKLRVRDFLCKAIDTCYPCLRSVLPKGEGELTTNSCAALIRNHNRNSSTPRPVARQLVYKPRLAWTWFGGSERGPATIRATGPTHSCTGRAQLPAPCWRRRRRTWRGSHRIRARQSSRRTKPWSSLGSSAYQCYPQSSCCCSSFLSCCIRSKWQRTGRRKSIKSFLTSDSPSMFGRERLNGYRKGIEKAAL